MRYVIGILMAVVAPLAHAVCAQSGYVMQWDMLPTGTATLYLKTSPQVNVVYSFTTSSERLIGAISVSRDDKVRIVGDAAECPDTGLTRIGGVILRVTVGE